MVEFVEQHPGVREVALSIDDDPRALRRWAAAHAVPGLVLHEHGGGAAARQAGLAGIPLFIVIDRQGRIVATRTGAGASLEDDLDDAVQQAQQP